MRNLTELRSMLRSVPGSAKAFTVSSLSSSGSISMGSFSNLKIAAEKLVKEQASMKTELEMANTKLKKSMEHIHSLEDRLWYAMNENSTLKVKEKEDSKLWNGLECKMSSMKALCDQLTETLRQLACQVQEAEQDKKLFQERLAANSNSFDSLQLHMTNLSADLGAAEENLRKSKQELMELKTEKEEMEKQFEDERCRATNLISEKDCTIKELEGTVANSKLCLESVDAKLGEVQHQLYLKVDNCKCLLDAQEILETEKKDLQSNNENLSKSLQTSNDEIRDLQDLIQSLVQKLIELDNHNAAVSNDVSRLYSTFDTFYDLVLKEKNLIAKHAQSQFSCLHDQFENATSENKTLRSETEELKNKVIELQKAQEFMMVQQAEECRVAEERNRKLESEAENLTSKKTELEAFVAKLEKKIEYLLAASCESENKMLDLLTKLSSLESENQDIQDKLQVELQGKIEELHVLQKEFANNEQSAESLEKQITLLHANLEEKELLHRQFNEREKQLQEQKDEIQASLIASRVELEEAKKQQSLMMESKQLELTKHLKEISQRNDQAINEIRRKFESEKLEIVNLEKEKADKILIEMEKKFEQKIAEEKEESKRYLMRVQEEHASLINHVQQKHDKKIMDLSANHCEELKNFQLRAEDGLRENTMLLRKEHENQMRSLRHQLEDECKKLHEELELQKNKEERQRALLQLQWKVMDGNQHEDQEVNSRKEYSISSIKKTDTDSRKKSQSAFMRPESEKDPSLLRATQTPVAQMGRKDDKVSPGNVMKMPKHSRKVTRREYEVETSNGRTITKRKKTKSTVMFGEPTKHKRIATPRNNASQDVMKVKNGDRDLHPTNIGELFTEGSLNPYADDPYAFD
ncbi:hypothetical protein Sjap_022140 [Stephania japonica]|uniref:Synaptonemal complex protein 1 n=1 Tax=Stephania japonica TaxID=461633 RepID=A0AAP0HPL1_9MAGN